MDQPVLTLSNFMENFIGPIRVNSFDFMFSDYSLHLTIIQDDLIPRETTGLVVVISLNKDGFSRS